MIVDTNQLIQTLIVAWMTQTIKEVLWKWLNNINKDANLKASSSQGIEITHW